MAFSGKKKQYVYGRVHNPTQTILENLLANLEKGEAGLVMSSGMAAVAGTLYTLLEPGDRIVAHSQMYGNSYKLIVEELPRRGYDVVLANLTDLNETSDSINEKTKIVFFESPTNPTLDFIDVAAISKIIDRKKTKLIVDNTILTPCLFNPLEHGADVVIHSMTKYINGHGDVLGGAIISSREIIQLIRKNGLRYLTGSCLSPFSCYLIIRGLKTLSIRMEKHCSSAMKIVNFLKTNSNVERVYYPSKNEYYKSSGGLVSFELKGGLESCRVFVNSCTLIKNAVSFGDAETLIQHPETMTHSSFSERDKMNGAISHSLLRLSVGLEDVEDIIDDLSQGLSF